MDADWPADWWSVVLSQEELGGYCPARLHTDSSVVSRQGRMPSDSCKAATLQHVLHVRHKCCEFQLHRPPKAQWIAGWSVLPVACWKHLPSRRTAGSWPPRVKALTMVRSTDCYGNS
jgi:hypothetical protein